MLSEFLKDYLPIIIFLVIALGLSGAFVVVNLILSPKHPDPEKLKYKNNFFDLISIGYGVRNFEDLINGLKESYRVLKKNGKLIILETSVPNNFLIKYLYLLFTSIYVPLISFIFTKNIKAYNYLLDSTKEFPHEKKFKKILSSVGFKNIESKKKFFGISTIYILTK